MKFPLILLKNQLKELHTHISLCPGMQLISGSVLLLFDGQETPEVASTARLVVIDFNHSFHKSNEIAHTAIDTNYLHGIQSLTLLLESVLGMPTTAPPRRVINTANADQVKNKEDWYASFCLLCSSMLTH